MEKCSSLIYHTHSQHTARTPATPKKATPYHILKELCTLAIKTGRPGVDHVVPLWRHRTERLPNVEDEPSCAHLIKR